MVTRITSTPAPTPLPATATPAPPPADPVAAGLESFAGEIESRQAVTDLDVAEAEIAQQQQLQASVAASNTEILLQANGVIRDTLVGVAHHESVKTTMADDKARAPMELFGQVLAKHGVDLRVWVGDFALELACVGAMLGYAAPVYLGVKAEIEARRKAGSAPAPAPAGETFTATFPPGDPRSVSLNRQ